MRTLEELLLLASESISLWLRGFTRLGFFYCLGWTVHILCVFASVLLGPVSQVVATLVFVVGVLALVTSLVLMIHALEPRLRAPATVSTDEPQDLETASVTVPRLVFQAQRRLPVVAAVIGPFLAVYAVWGLIDEQVNLLFSYNNVLRGADQIDYWSVSLTRVTFYLVLAAVTFVLKRLVDAVQRRVQRSGVAVLALLLEGLWVFASFLALAAAASDLRGWIGTRRVVVGVQSRWNALLDALPDWRLPFELTLPEALAGMVDLVWRTVLPGLSTTILLPLVWLALTATVFGWRDVTGRQVVTGERTQQVISSVRQRTADLGPLTALTTWVTADLQGKYLPVVHALRLVWRSGPSVMAAYLIWTALLTAAAQWVLVLARTVAGDLTNPELSVYLLFEELLHGLVFTTLLMASYAAAFDRALLGVMGEDQRSRRLRLARRRRATDTEAADAALDVR
ncbi:hypothetical protein [Auraticoccus monumenti]|uniref:hypothetical protein n=1 Tax=Auraticoccus monumenti TaxID=675864 RepID=UPI0012FBBAF0|nr:hypothetical protein [Auraticoccus monumenti]